MMYDVVGASSIVFGISLVLIIWGRRTQRKRITRAGIVLSVLSFCSTGIVWMGCLFLGIGPIYSMAAMPHQFKEMAEIANANTSDANVECLGSFLDSEHVWRLSLSSDQLDRVVAKYALVIVPPKDVPHSFWLAFPRWWRPSHNVNCRYFSTFSFPTQSRGPDGDHCFAMYDSQDQSLYVWYKFNF